MKASRIASVVRLLHVINLKFIMHWDLEVSLNYIVCDWRLSVYKKISSNFEFKIFFEVGRDWD